MMNRFLLISFLFFYNVSEAASSHLLQGNQGVAVSSQPYATKVGMNILRQGGNAIDSAVAIGYALAVVHPCCGNIGGGGFMLIRLANGKMTFIDFREKAPHRAKPSLYLDPKGNVIANNLSGGHVIGSLSKPYLAIGIPGTVKGLDYALSKYGTFSRRQVIEPAIKLAEKGYVLNASDAAVYKLGENNFRQEPNVCAIFLKNNQTYSAGKKLVQANLALTLKQIASQGPSAFYKGTIAQSIVKASQAHGGLITLSDLKNYRVVETAPLTCRYRGYQIITAPPPGSGVTICETLRILESHPMKRLGFHSATSIHYLAEALRFAYLDRNRYLGDPHFTNNPINYLLSSSHIAAIQKQIHPEKATPTASIKFVKTGEGNNTTSFVVADKKGNAVSVTYTLNDYFGAKVIPGDKGFFLNNELADFTIKSDTPNMYGLVQGAQNEIGPDRRPLSSMSPTFLLKNQALFMIVGTPGGSTIPSQLVNVILNVIDYGMDIQAAEDAPRIHMQALPDKIFMEPLAVSNDAARLLKKMGYTLQLGSPYGSLLWGVVSGILIDPLTHQIFGAIDHRHLHEASS